MLGFPVPPLFEVGLRRMDQLPNRESLSVTLANSRNPGFCLPETEHRLLTLGFFNRRGRGLRRLGELGGSWLGMDEPATLFSQGAEIIISTLISMLVILNTDTRSRCSLKTTRRTVIHHSTVRYM